MSSVRDFRIALLAAYVDHCKAFDSVNPDVLWRILALGGIPPPKLVSLISGLYSGTESAVRCDGSILDYFPNNIGVRQGFVLAPTLFNTCMDHVLGRMSEKSGCVVSFGIVRITDLDFADDAVVFAVTTEVLGGQSRLVCEFPGSKPRSMRSVTSWMRPLSQSL